MHHIETKLYDIDANAGDDKWMQVRVEPLMSDSALAEVIRNQICLAELPADGESFEIKDVQPRGFNIQDSSLLAGILKESALMQSSCGTSQYL